MTIHSLNLEVTSAIIYVCCLMTLMLAHNHTFVSLGILGLFPWKFRDFLVIVVHALTNFGVMYLHDFS
jgi:hypothetical protein